jgi:hypothetical protein
MLTGIFKKPEPKQRINPRIRAYGKARLDIARRATSRADWDNLWKEPSFPFPFKWGEWWKQCIEYKVDDFAAEVGFFTDILSLPVNAFDPEYAMFTSPAQDFFLAVVPTPEGGRSTPPDALRVQFMVEDLLETASELERRGIVFEQRPRPCEKGSSMYIGYFRTPHGICIDLWGVVAVEADAEDSAPADEPEEAASLERPQESEQENERGYLEDAYTGEEQHEREPDRQWVAQDKDLKVFDSTPVRTFPEVEAERDDEFSEAINFGAAEEAADEQIEADEASADEVEDEEEEEEDDTGEDSDDDALLFEYVYEDDL